MIDVGGAYVLPGLIDAHTHASTVAAAHQASSRARRRSARGRRASIRTSACARSASTAASALPRTLAAGLFVTPNLGDSVLADPRLAPLAALPTASADPTTWRSSCEVNIARGVDHIKTRSTERAGLPEQDPRVQVYDERQIRAVVERGAPAARRRDVPRPRRRGDPRLGAAPACARSSTGPSPRRPRSTRCAPAGRTWSRRCRRSSTSPSRAGSTRTRGSSSAGRDARDDAKHDPRRDARGIPIDAGTDTSYTTASLSTSAARSGCSGSTGSPTWTRCGRRPRPAASLVGTRARARPSAARLRSRRGRRGGEPALRPRGARQRPARRRGRVGRPRGGVAPVGARGASSCRGSARTTVRSRAPQGVQLD